MTPSETPFFAGISGMSFFGEANDGDFDELAADTPVWSQGARLSRGALAQVPTESLGPWGRSYHTPLERAKEDYLFRRLPALLEDLTRRRLAS